MSAGPEYVPGARVKVGQREWPDLAVPGEVRRAFEVDGEWTYYVALDDGRSVTCTGAILTTGTLPP